MQLVSVFYAKGKKMLICFTHWGPSVRKLSSILSSLGTGGHRYCLTLLMEKSTFVIQRAQHFYVFKFCLSLSKCFNNLQYFKSLVEYLKTSLLSYLDNVYIF